MLTGYRKVYINLGDVQPGRFMTGQFSLQIFKRLKNQVAVIVFYQIVKTPELNGRFVIFFDTLHQRRGEAILIEHVGHRPIQQ